MKERMKAIDYRMNAIGYTGLRLIINLPLEFF
jgi:hypothetical protein